MLRRVCLLAFFEVLLPPVGQKLINAALNCPAVVEKCDTNKLTLTLKIKYRKRNNDINYRGDTTSHPAIEIPALLF